MPHHAHMNQILLILSLVRASNAHFGGKGKSTFAKQAWHQNVSAPAKQTPLERLPTTFALNQLQTPADSSATARKMPHKGKQKAPQQRGTPSAKDAPQPKDTPKPKGTVKPKGTNKPTDTLIKPGESSKSKDASKSKETAKANAETSSETPPETPPEAPLGFERIPIPCECCGGPLPSWNIMQPRRCAACDRLVNDWVNATSWAELIAFNREFIKGTRNCTVYAKWSTFADKEQHPDLLRLHDYGLIVTFAQPEKHSSGKETSGKWKGRWYETKDRGYIIFALPTNHPKIDKAKINVVIAILLQMEDIELVSYYDQCDYAPGTWHKGRYYANPVGTSDISEVEAYKRFYSTVGVSSTGATTQKYRAADAKDALISKAWRRCKQNGLDVVDEKDLPTASKGSRAFGAKLPITLGMQPVIMKVVTRDWPPTKTDLTSTLEAVAIAAGLKPIFSEHPEQEVDFEESDELEDTELAGEAQETVEANVPESSNKNPAPKLPEELPNVNTEESEEAEGKHESDLDKLIASLLGR